MRLPLKDSSLISSALKLQPNFHIMSVFYDSKSLVEKKQDFMTKYVRLWKSDNPVLKSPKSWKYS